MLFLKPGSVIKSPAFAQASVNETNRSTSRLSILKHIIKTSWFDVNSLIMMTGNIAQQYWITINRQVFWCTQKK